MPSYCLLCMICDARTGTFRRLKPHKLYVCFGCLRSQGPMDSIISQIPVYTAAFRERHPGTMS